MAIPSTPAQAAKWMRAERDKRGWSTTDLANRARGFAREAGDQMELKQQSISGFETKPPAKKIPHWLRYVEQAFDDSDGETKEDPYLPIAIMDDSIQVRQIPTFGGLGGGGSGEGDEGTISFSRHLVQSELRARADDLLAIEAEGNSMEPEFLGGDQMLIDVRKRSTANPGAFCLWDGDGHVIKYLERIMGSEPPRVRIISKNRELYEPQERLEEEINIIGRVVWYGRRVR